jgi:FtsH-binding integral membrane protein
VTLQPYLPPPVEVEGNLAAASYDERLRFVRRMYVLHGASVALAAGAGLAVASVASWKVLAWIALAAALALSASRRLAKGTNRERPFVLAALPLLAVSLGGLVVQASAAGLPFWTLGLASACAVAYTLLCGRDFSFVGQFVLGAAGCAGLVSGLALIEGVEFNEAWTGAVLAWAYLGFLVYDGAALLNRRRPGEEIEAVADLYRDSLNFVTYPVRVYLHWKTGPDGGDAPAVRPGEP